MIHSGTIVDGTGNPAYTGSLLITGDRVRVLRGRVEAAKADRVIDATGMIVAPGFIDIHSHSDLSLLEDGRAESQIRQGVTSEIIGVDGLSYAPFKNQEHLISFAQQNAGIAGYPQLDYDWQSVGELLERYDQRTNVNVGTFVGNSALRIAAHGWSSDLADGRSLSIMQATLREAMSEGAFGVSTGLDYPPGRYANTDELVKLASEAAKSGGIYHTHARYALGDRHLDPFREALLIGQRASVPVHITHFSRAATARAGEGARALLELIERARDEGIDVTFDCYPYQWGGSRLTLLLPEWLQGGHPAELKTKLNNHEQRNRLSDYLAQLSVTNYTASRPFSDLRIGGLTHPDHATWESRYLSEIITESGKEAADVLSELITQNDTASFTRSSADPGSLWRFVCHPLGMIASDSVAVPAHPSPRVYGTFPHVLGAYVRDEQLLSLAEAIRKMTSFPAQRLGLVDRGMLIDNAIADVVIFDPAKVHAPATYENPKTFSIGIKYVLVSGALVLDNSELIDVRPGRALYSKAAL